MPTGQPAVPSPEFSVKQTHRQDGRGRGEEGAAGRVGTPHRPGGVCTSVQDPSSPRDGNQMQGQRSGSGSQSAVTTLGDVTHPQAHVSPKEKQEAGAPQAGNAPWQSGRLLAARLPV